MRMDPQLLLYLDGTFDYWRKGRRTLNSREKSLLLLEAVLASEPQLDSYDTPLRRLLRRLGRTGEVPIGILVNEIELELLATLGQRAIFEFHLADGFESTKTDLAEQMSSVSEISRITELSHRYWALHDSQDQVLQRGAGAVRSKIAQGGGEARKRKSQPLHERVVKIALAGLTRSPRQNLKYGKWATHFDFENGIHEELAEQDQSKVTPSTIGTWVRAALPYLTNRRRKDELI